LEANAGEPQRGEHDGLHPGQTDLESHIIRLRFSSARLLAGLRRRLRFELGAGVAGWMTTGVTAAGVVAGVAVIVGADVVVFDVVVLVVFVFP